MNKARITYRFDRNPIEKPLNSEETVVPLSTHQIQVVKDTFSIQPQSTDYGAWNSSYDEETLRVEQAIRNSNRPDQQRGYVEWPDETIHEPELQSFTTRYSSSRTPWFKIMASIIGAVATGALFGFLVLQLFNQDFEPNQSVNTTPVNTGVDIAATPPEQPAIEASATVGTSAMKGMSVSAVHVLTRELTFLQNGVFSNIDGVTAAKQELSQKGLAVAVETSDDKYYVYAGIAGNRDDALLISQKVQAANTEVYLKNYTRPAISLVSWNGKDGEVFSQYFNKAGRLFGMINSLTVIHLGSSVITPMASNSYTMIKNEHKAWVNLYPEVSNGFLQEQQAKLQKMSSAMNTAIFAIEEYSKNPSKTYMWSGQTALLEYAVLEKELLEDITIQE